MIRGVIFDLDNTLYNYDICDKVANEVLAEYVKQTIHIEREEYVTNLKLAKAKVKSQLGDTGASHNRMLYMQVFLEQLGHSSVSYALEMYDKYWDTMLREMKTYTYVRPTLQMLKEEKIKIGILTDLTAHIQHRKIKALHLEEYIDVLVTSEEAGREKPNPCMFQLMMDKMGMLPNELLMIGDSLEKDIEGARTMGIEGLLFDYRSGIDAERYITNELKRMVGK